MVQRERDSVETFARSAYDLFGRATIKMDQETHRSLAGRRILGILAPMGNTFPIRSSFATARQKRSVIAEALAMRGLSFSQGLMRCQF
jgi:hypothetical protein